MPKYYRGFATTPLLWTGDLLGLKQFNWTPSQDLEEIPLPNVKFGHQMEVLLNYAFQNDPFIEVLATNLQINGTDRTLGEIDALLRLEQKIYHIESAFKFYLLDNIEFREDLSNWIGPNRTDSLQHKIEHVKNQQFPLIDLAETRDQLFKHGISNQEILQRVYFKGMLFLPHNDPQIDLKGLNPLAIAGTYLRTKELFEFKESKIHVVRSKKDWILTPIVPVEWKSMNAIQDNISEELDRNQSVFLWRKDPKGHISRHFIVWW